MKTLTQTNMKTLTQTNAITLTQTNAITRTQTNAKTLWPMARWFATSIVYVIVFATCAIAQVTPSGGLTDDDIIRGSSITIGWPKYIEAPSVDIYLWNATTSERREIAGNVPAAQGAFVWNVPIDVVSGSRYRFVVASNDAHQRMMSASWVTVGQQSMHKVAAEFVSRPTHPSASAITTNELTIAPNPSNDVVRIRFGSDFVTMRFVSLDGATILERSLCMGERTVDVDVQHLISGVYTVVLIADDGRCISSLLHVMP